MAKRVDPEKCKKLLLKERDRLIQEHAKEAAGRENPSELADYDDHHPGDAASDTYERTKDFALDENFRELMERIEEALRKCADGTYGLCDRCGDPINPDRMKAIPYATLCIECQEIIERR